jgi:hypothetical protein
MAEHFLWLVSQRPQLMRRVVRLPYPWEHATTTAPIAGKCRCCRSDSSLTQLVDTQSSALNRIGGVT